MVSKEGKVAIAFVLVLAVAAAVLIGWYCWKKRRGSTSRSITMSDTKDTVQPVYDDESDSESDEENDTFGFDNLGMCGTTVNVHRCHSVSCDVCNPISNNHANGVYFIKAKTKEKKSKKVIEDIEEVDVEDVEEGIEGIEVEEEQEPRVSVSQSGIKGELESVEVEP